MTKSSKYLGKTFGNWTCVSIGINNVQGKKAKAPYHQNYYYIFQRKTSDGKALKSIRLNSGEASKVYKGKVDVETILTKREAKAITSFNRGVTYRFIKEQF